MIESPRADPAAPCAAGLDCEFRCLTTAGAWPEDAHQPFLFDEPGADLSRLRACEAVVLATQGPERAATLLASGVPRVLLGEAALRDGAIVERLAERFGPERIGVHVRARRLEVRWSFDTVSNADFKVLTPSLGAPAWEALLADDTGTGTQVAWWIAEMLRQGATQALLQVDIRDDADLNLCADAFERFGERLWIAPLAQDDPALAPWIEFGKARRIALPPAAFALAPERFARAPEAVPQAGLPG